MPKFNIGDHVKVVDKDFSYTKYDDFFFENNITMHDVAMYDYGVAAKENVEYEIIQKGTHTIFTDRELYLIKSLNKDKTYIVESDGIEFSKRKMTIEEIEELLGYRIELV